MEISTGFLVKSLCFMNFILNSLSLSLDELLYVALFACNAFLLQNRFYEFYIELSFDRGGAALCFVLIAEEAPRPPPHPLPLLLNSALPPAL